ncbi:dynein regulatory complex subunit 6-like [Acropora millepora]|uniref:dynein regulatory complex subunit 6-like n=1 Tax=Acropora millepora TaxID=45264 RepID=UPI001CF3FE0A|nr:dynein regulatory complex subunit 6-like [Acropora millepora]
MTSLKNCDPRLRRYLLIHRLPDVFEAIVSALAINCPDDPETFILEKLKCIITYQDVLDNLRWDSFIDEKLKPKHRVVKASVLDFLWSYEDENSQPTPEMYQTAYNLYNGKLKTSCFSAWMRYHKHKKRKKMLLAKKMQNARLWHKHRVERIYLQQWIEWVAERKERSNVISCRIRRVLAISLLRVVFRAWHSVAVDARKTKEYFERIERGEIIDSELEGFSRVRADGKDDISSLPRNVALRIFSFVNVGDLGRCARVCRNWKVIIQANTLWSKVDFSVVKHSATNKVTSSLIHKCRPFLGHLNLRGCYGLSSGSLKLTAQCKNLQDLNLSDCTGVNDEVVKSISIGCTALLYLNLANTSISDASLRYLGRYCINLLYLSMAYCSKFTNKGLSYLANGKGCNKVVHLDLTGCEQITEEGYKFISMGCSFLSTIVLNELPGLRDDCIQALTSECRTLKSVSIMNSPFLSDASFKCLSQCKRLRKIRVEGNNRLTDASVKVLTKSCPMLDHIYLVDCPRITDIALKALASFKHLNVVNVADCVRIQDTGVRQVVEGPSGAKIKELNLTNCVRVSDVTLLRIAQRCHNLVYASFCYCEHVTDAGVELLGTLPSLVSLDLSGCNIQDQGVAALGNNPKFRDISLAECPNITDLGLQKMCQQCRQLENFDVSRCKGLTDNAIKNLAFCCRLLRTLKLAGCSKLTDSSLQYLSGVCHYLEALDLSGCVHITDKSLRFLRKGCKKMSSLTILYCRNVTKSAVQKMQTKCERVLYNADDPSPVLP